MLGAVRGAELSAEIQGVTSSGGVLCTLDEDQILCQGVRGKCVRYHSWYPLSTT
jgi:hypothetical protein